MKMVLIKTSRLCWCCCPAWLPTFPAACFSSPLLFLLGAHLFLLFGVQIAACQPGLEAASKLEVGKLISGSINEILWACDSTEERLVFNELEQTQVMADD